ncbi:hypothetical protein FACS1894190_08510 [Spirochaetia bacterium]|nr:hypothetical protein FACS1894190_08510 [Spirochaetia bacterium]
MGKGTGTNYQKLFYKGYEQLFEQKTNLGCELRTKIRIPALLDINLQLQKEIETCNRNAVNGFSELSRI